jgi:outer membrane protein assembly factor BamA
VESESDGPKVVIDEVRFDGPIHAPTSAVEAAIDEAKKIEFNGDDDWLNEFAEITIRARWQNYGYFRANATATVEPLGSDFNAQHFRVTVHVDEDLQYHLGSLRFVDSNPFPRGDVNPVSVTELRELIPLREGEIFDVSKIRQGIEALTKKYNAIGYVDFTAVPKTEIDDKLQRISLTLELDEQKQYRIGEVKVVADPGFLAALGSKLVSGEIFDATAIDDFVKQNRASLPANLSERDYLHETRNTRLGVVDLSFDFRSLDSRGCTEAIR